jgi:dimethylaniline monooxygenase (N-oxide forming)
MFPRAEDVHGYLREYATHFGALNRILTETRVLGVAHASGGGYSVRWSSGHTEHEDRFAGVIVASGRFQRPRLPALPGIEDLAAQRRLRHSTAYRGRDEFRGRRVLVPGNSISGVEIASDLAAEHTIGVISAARKPRYVIQKIVRGQPTDWRWFNRFSALLASALPPEELAAGMREAVLAEAGDPARFGGLGVDPRVPPKLSQSQEYLAQVAEARIAVRPTVTSLDAGTARFADGSCSEVDEVICATGYDLDLEYLAPGIRRIVQGSQTQLNLHARTFTPELPGLGFLGQFQLIGPHFPIFELQARWIAGVWSGSLPARSTERMYAGIAEHQATREMAPIDMYPALAALLAGELGVEPDLAAVLSWLRGCCSGRSLLRATDSTAPGPAGGGGAVPRRAG